jgi:hypothetical protein
MVHSYPMGWKEARGLPKRFGNWHTIYTRMNRWSKSGVMDRVFDQLQLEQIVRIKIEAIALDSTSRFKREFLILQPSQPLCLTGIHAAELRLPGIDGVLGHAALARHILDLTAGLHLLQRGNDLRLAMLTLPHLPLLPQPEIILPYVRF